MVSLMTWQYTSLRSLGTSKAAWMMALMSGMGCDGVPASRNHHNQTNEQARCWNTRTVSHSTALAGLLHRKE